MKPRSLPSGLVSAFPLLLAACASVPADSNGGAPDARRWRDRLIEPVTQPTLFESPVIDSQVRPMLMHQELPNDSIFQGGSVDVVALQLRYAIHERVALIAVKDGYVDLDPDAGSSESGVADLAAGVKYAVVDDLAKGNLVTVGMVYEFASGDEDVFQGNGDGVLRPFVAVGFDRDKFNTLLLMGYNYCLDDDEESTSFDYHAHLSYEAWKSVTPLLEVNGITWTDGGNALAADFEGGDLINLGATDPDGTVVTGALGARWAACENISVGLAYELPLTSREDLIDSRGTLDLVWSF